MSQKCLKEPTHLVLDFDSTLTVKDTMMVLGNLSQGGDMSWQGIFDAYMVDYEEYMRTPFPWQKYDRVEYSQWLASRKWIEERSAQRVQNAGFFRSVTLHDVDLAVDTALHTGELQLRPGWDELFRLFLPNESPATRAAAAASRISILSVNWSETAIRKTLWQAARNLRCAESAALASMINSMEIHANEIQGLGAPEGSSGRICRLVGADIRTSDDKLRYLNAMVKDQKQRVVYVGDSATDFDCLCAADLGVWINGCSNDLVTETAAETFKPLKITPSLIRPVFETDGHKPLFYWTPDLHCVFSALTSPASPSQVSTE